MVPRGAMALDNPNGTAPGLFIEVGAKVVILLPGPPREMQPMVNGLCEGLLLARAGDERVYRAALFLTGRGESHVEEIAAPLYSAWARETPPIETTILASPGQVELHLSLRSKEAEAARARLPRRATRWPPRSAGRSTAATAPRSSRSSAGNCRRAA